LAQASEASVWLDGLLDAGLIEVLPRALARLSAAGHGQDQAAVQKAPTATTTSLAATSLAKVHAGGQQRIATSEFGQHLLPALQVLVELLTTAAGVGEGGFQGRLDGEVCLRMARLISEMRQRVFHSFW
jgi:hypothetical protein